MAALAGAHERDDLHPQPESGARICAAPNAIRRIPELVVRAVEEADLRRRRLAAGQKVAVIHVGEHASAEEPIALPVRRVPTRAIAIGLAAAFAIFGVSLGARGRSSATSAKRIAAAAPTTIHADAPTAIAVATPTAVPVATPLQAIASAPIVTRPRPITATATKPRSHAR